MNIPDYQRNHMLDGYVDEVRISTIPRYSGEFTPRNKEFDKY
jgi:hypothetical protein